jgi:hypothetical protein
MPGIQRFATLLVALLILTTAGCSEGDSGTNARLTEEETRLVEETLQLIRIRLETTRDPAAAEEMRKQTGDFYTDEEREFLLDRLASRAGRGELVMAALHDSLQAMRETLFPPANE